jgi:hypothetical protein
MSQDQHRSQNTKFVQTEIGNLPFWLRIFCFLVFMLFFFAPKAESIRWPFDPGNVSLPLGNDYGEYQYYGGDPYYHQGIDIMQVFGSHVYAVKAGVVKAVLTTSAQYHWRVSVGDSAGTQWCDGWLYAHLDENTIQVQVGDTVQVGDYLGDLVYWPVSGFHHLHFVKIRNHGMPWESDWKFIANPLDELVPIDDSSPPVIENARGDYKFAFCQNNTHTYFDPGASVKGDVDIVSKIYDKVNHPNWKLAPYSIEYSIQNDSIGIGPILSFIFTDTLWWDQNVDVTYQDDAICNTRGDYDYRDFYFLVTNTDGDSVIESADKYSAWHTQDYPNGTYWVKVKAYDRLGNFDSDSMQVFVSNLFQISGKVGLSDNPSDSNRSVVTIQELGISDTTDKGGSYLFVNLAEGNYHLQITHPGYVTFDTLIQVSRNLILDFTLEPGPFIRGDANHDGVVNVTDVVYLINYLFIGGPLPVPYSAGDVDGNTLLNVSDVVYLINYLFVGGPPPKSGH